MSMLTLFAALLGSSGAAPTASAEPEDRDIIVERPRNRDREIQEFVRALTPSRIGGQLSRFNQGICPAVIGISKMQSTQAVARLRAVAKAAEIDVAGEECAPNALAIIVPDKEEFVAALRKKYPSYFRDPIGTPILMPDQRGPAVAWKVNGLLDSDGVRAKVVRPSTGGKYYSVPVRWSSRIKPSSRPDFLLSVLVIEGEALAGLTTIQFADYAAMRLYTQADPGRLKEDQQKTILKVVDAAHGSPVPLTLTTWDLAFLKSLYKSEPLQYATRQRSAISRHLRGELEKDK